jgi:hypothetical protein
MELKIDCTKQDAINQLASCLIVNVLHGKWSYVA